MSVFNLTSKINTGAEWGRRCIERFFFFFGHKHKHDNTSAEQYKKTKTKMVKTKQNNIYRLTYVQMTSGSF